MSVLLATEDLSLSTHAGIDHDHMNGVCGEIAKSALNNERRLHNVVSGQGVGNINELNAPVDRENNALHDAYIFILEAKVGKQGDDRDLFVHTSQVFRNDGALWMQILRGDPYCSHVDEPSGDIFFELRSLVCGL
jgi:hypothetical protein